MAARLAGTGSVTDYSISIDDLQAQFPGCTTVAVVVSWFGNSTDVTACQIYPSTTYINGTFEQANGTSDLWRCSGLTQSSPGLIPIPQTGNAFIYGGTPSDQSIVRCIRDLKSRGLRAVFYPFILMTASGEPWRGNITYNGTDISSAATAAIDNFLGSAAISQFTQDTTNLTVAYSGSPTDYTYRRMILHYANLCCVAGGVDLFLLGSEFRGLEAVRGQTWTKAGTVSGGTTTWDYPFVAGLAQLADDVRTVFNNAGLAKDTANLHNLVAYSADWSVWMGYQHPGENGQWPHLDQLYASSNIDLVSFDNYLPLSDWTTGDGGLDAENWLNPSPNGAWPPTAATFNGLGMSGQPTIYSLAYLKANIEGGEKFNWFYNDSTNLGIGLDPNGTALMVSLPQGDRLTQSRNAYAANQQLLANKQLRWWWNNHALRRSMIPARDGCRRARRPSGCRTQSRSRLPNMAFRRATRALISRTSSTTRLRARAARRSGRSGTRAPALREITGRGATICFICSRCRRCTNIGSLTATMPRSAACR